MFTFWFLESQTAAVGANNCSWSCITENMLWETIGYCCDFLYGGLTLSELATVSDCCLDTLVIRRPAPHYYEFLFILLSSIGCSRLISLSKLCKNYRFSFCIGFSSLNSPLLAFLRVLEFVTVLRIIREFVFYWIGLLTGESVSNGAGVI